MSRLMADLGLNAYRFSIAWTRILPAGRGQVNQAGLDFYSRLVDALLAADIQPFITLYHWDLPQALQEAGGWPQRDTVAAFVEYADVVSRALGDRVKHWITHNEPWCISFLGHQMGEHAPGLCDMRQALTTSHHVLLSHGQALPVLRGNSPGSEVGITLNFTHAQPASHSVYDLAQARWFDGYFNRWFIDPLFGRHYPADMVANYRRLFIPDGLTWVQPGDIEAIAAPLDFLGVNYYFREVFRDNSAADNLPQQVFPAPDDERTLMGWEIYPEGLYKLLNRLHFTYEIPKMYVTENGVSWPDQVGADGRVRDSRRIRYLHDHFVAAHRALANGVPLAGYFVWSLMDNFEWAKGYKQRFGLVYVDYATQARIPKESASWYRQLIAKNTLPPPPA